MKQKLLSLLLLTTVSGFSQNFTLVEDSGILPVQRIWDEIAFEDIDGDGFVDLYTGGAAPNFSTVGRMYKNDGTGNFILSDDETFIKKREGGLAFGDVNGDGFPDMIVSGAYGSPGGALTRLYINDGNGNFTLDESSSFVNVSRGDFRMFDYDNDGDLDILISGNGSQGVAFNLYENDGAGNFTLNNQSGLEQVGLNHASIVIADLDNDGFLDIATNGSTSSSGGAFRTRIFKNNGNSTFSIMTQPDFDYNAAGAIAVGDIDNNGTLDLIFLGQAHSSDDNPLGFGSAMFLNDGNANFTLVENTNFIGHRDYPSIVLADFDNDGSLDLMTMGRITANSTAYGTYLYMNDGQGNFTLVEDTPFTAHGFGKITVADVNNDGNIDVLITGMGDGPGNTAVAKLYLNNVENVGIDTVNYSKFKIYPNPVKDILNIESLSNDKLKCFEIYALNGSLIKQKNLDVDINNIDVSFLNSGVYILSLTTENGTIIKSKIVKY